MCEVEPRLCDVGLGLTDRHKDVLRFGQPAFDGEDAPNAVGSKDIPWLLPEHRPEVLLGVLDRALLGVRVGKGSVGLSLGKPDVAEGQKSIRVVLDLSFLENLLKFLLGILNLFLRQVDVAPRGPDLWIALVAFEGMFDMVEGLTVLPAFPSHFAQPHVAVNVLWVLLCQFCKNSRCGGIDLLHVGHGDVDGGRSRAAVHRKVALAVRAVPQTHLGRDRRGAGLSHRGHYRISRQHRVLPSDAKQPRVALGVVTLLKEQPLVEAHRNRDGADVLTSVGIV
mmetsp:Transcript_21658/g.56544  ORF Transcript_21658/g.56544 Transcript_21658/m.56544 type:complete len:280 (-) Transcript_21658:995-1834(-)